MDTIQVTLALVTAAVAGAMTYVKAHTMPLDQPAVTADIFACQQWPEGQDARAPRLASTISASGRPACLTMTN
ncbi:hypothetical protein LL06_08325 [Hoeflea sp. BAL378]|uniref:hypothetical protein n=1 Tax=Hoeflea sp. BAL378 TaxID=1547437 RepID=UPI00051328A1|nr:hypothetical protein [Hoeflea sp. BAL378]KGF69817.1 hypothetical protein LL06_08325 [Hoeflea sp. BAL378]